MIGCTITLRKLVRYIKLHSGQFNVCTRDVRERLHRIPGINDLSIIILPCDVHGMNKLYANDLNEM